MNNFTYPKLKYRAAAAPTDERDYDHVRVENPVQEHALGDGWFDTPGEMRAAALGETRTETATRFARMAAAEYAPVATPAATTAKRKR